jgi:RNA polymerase sigma factor (sigma-70 family)
MKSTERFSDEDLIKRILDGEQRLFEMLIRRYNPFLYRTGRSYGYQHEDTMDLMQETFINAYLNLSRFENRSSFKTWIIRIMLNNCYHKRQKLSYRNEILMEHGITEKSIPMYSTPSQADTTRRISSRELSHIVEASLLEVPSEYRLVFLLREMSGFSVAETAAALNITGSNVKVRLSRAKALLRKEIEKAYTTEDIFDFNLVYCDVIVNQVMVRIASIAGGG